MARRRNNPSTAFSEDTIPEADFLDSRGYRLMSDWTWEHPTAKPTEEDHAAAQVLMDEWGYGPIRGQRAKRAKAKLPPKKQAQAACPQHHCLLLGSFAVGSNRSASEAEWVLLMAPTKSNYFIYLSFP